MINFLLINHCGSTVLLLICVWLVNNFMEVSSVCVCVFVCVCVCAYVCVCVCVCVCVYLHV